MIRRKLIRCRTIVYLAFVGLMAPVSANGADRAQQAAFFESKVRPILVEHCFACHSVDADELGGKLFLDSLAGMTQGGESGPAVVPGDLDASLVAQAVRYDGIEMPPDQPLPEAAVHDIEKWIRDGAFFPKAKTPPSRKENAGDDVATVDLWSLKPIRASDVPAVAVESWADESWAVGAIDRFVLAEIESAGLRPTNDANARTLLRRLYYDLIGLPPSYDEIARFEKDCQTDRSAAVEEAVDALLARSQFGERWGRHWLDVARFAESNGNDGLGRNPTFPHAWRYRDYVIDAFNNDLPFDQFLTEQIAGDLMAYESAGERDGQLIATGFLALSAKPAKAMNNNFDMDVVADQIDAVTRGFMGFSVACARCHDHKFDPIPTRDYYAIAGFFTSTETMWGLAANEKLTAPPTDLHVLQTAARVMPPKNFVETAVLKESDTGKPKKIPASKWKPGTPLAMGVAAKKPRDCQINIKGDAKKLGDAVPRGFLSAIDVSIDDDDSPSRLHLAAWLTSPEHPLTARVYVNRVWQHLFGEGVVRTPDDFGVYGEKPTHPELLDYLARRFMENGWSTKRLIREIVLSRTYQLDSGGSMELATADAENKLLARHSRRRLDAEAIRDSMLWASGELDLTPGDGSLVRHRDILVNIAGDIHEPSDKRSVYLCYLRNAPPPELAAFNLPEFLAVTGERDESTIPAQALHLFNSNFVRSQADAMALRVTEDSSDRVERIRAAYHRALSRDASDDDIAEAESLIESLSVDGDDSGAWAGLCQALLATNEFRYVD